MNKIRGIRYAIVGAFLAACGASGAALAVPEVEDNFPIGNAQMLAIDSDRSVTVDGFLDSGDVDIYAFEAKAGDVVTFDIDGGIKSVPGSIDTFLTLLLPAPTYVAAAWNDDHGIVDEDSISPWDAYINQYRIPADGTYYVAVTQAPGRLKDGGGFVSGGGVATGSYTLIVTGVEPTAVPPAPPPPTALPPAPAPETKQISIDVKPRHGRMARIYPNSRHSITVALLSSADFDARKVDVSSLTFGHTGDEQSLRKCFKRGFDVNRDRRRDLICEFSNHKAEFELGDDVGILRGNYQDGTPFEGRDMLKAIPHKRHGRSADGTPFEGHHHGREHSRRDDDRDRDDHDRDHRFPHHRR